jgi:hypothetical protein
MQQLVVYWMVGTENKFTLAGNRSGFYLCTKILKINKNKFKRYKGLPVPASIFFSPLLQVTGPDSFTGIL